MVNSQIADVDLETLLDEIINPLEVLPPELPPTPPQPPEKPIKARKTFVFLGVQIAILVGFSLAVGFFWGKMHRQNREFQNLAHQTLEYLEQIHETVSQDPSENLPSLRPRSKNEEIAPITPV